MKTSHDPRHKKRIAVMQELFAWNYHKYPLKISTTKQIAKNLATIDAAITKSATARPFSQINLIDLAILRQAVFELIILPNIKNSPSSTNNQPILFKVIADEAVELAKQFGSESSPSFVNGVLGKLISEHQLEHQP